MTTEKTMNESTQEFTLSRNPQKAMQEMMETITALRELYKEESEALDTADIRRFMNLQERKIRIATDYHAGARQMIARKDEFKVIGPELRAHLTRAQESFFQVSTENMNSLSRMRRGVQRLSERIMAVARDAARNDTPNYSAGGTLNRNERAVSIGLNESA